MCNGGVFHADSKHVSFVKISSHLTVVQPLETLKVTFWAISKVLMDRLL